jgi:predicted aspartyl protease
MNRPRVESNHVPYVPITVHSTISAQSDGFEALVDTGYTGSVVVPVGAFSSNVPGRHRRFLRLADGSTVAANAYPGEVRIGATTPIQVAITELGGEAIIGMQVLDLFRLTIDHGRTIALDR